MQEVCSLQAFAGLLHEISMHNLRKQAKEADERW